MSAYTQSLDRFHRPNSLLRENTPPYSPALLLPETHEFLSHRDELTQQLLIPPLSDPYIQNWMTTMQAKLANRELSPSFMIGVENDFSGHLFENIAHTYLQNLNPDLVILSPRDTHLLYELSTIKEGIKEKVRTVPDGLIFQPDIFTSRFIGSCEYTMRRNLGADELKKRNKGKRKQIMLHATGKIGYDFFTRHNQPAQRNIGDRLNNLHDELPSRIIYDQKRFSTYIVTPEGDDRPFTHPNCINVQVPIDTHEIWNTAMHVVRELHQTSLVEGETSDEIVLFNLNAD